MRPQRKLTNKEWEEVKELGPGVHMFRGKKTLFYNGETLWDTMNSIIYHWKERRSWEVSIVLPGVEVIPWKTFYNCANIKTCESYETSEEVIFGILKEKGLSSLIEENNIGITAACYFQENPFSDIKQQKLINRFVLDLM